MKIKYRRYYLYYLLKTAFFVLSRVPLMVGLFIANALGDIAFFLVGKARNVAISNLDAAFGGDHGSNVRIARKVFRNLVKNGAEWIKLFVLEPKDLGKLVTEIEGLEHVDAVLAKGRGAIVMGFHFGNWELLPIYVKNLGYKGAVVGRRIYFRKYDKFIVGMRNRFNVKVIYRDESPKKTLRELRDGGIMGILADQDIASIDGVFVDFFGRPAYTPTAPVKLAIAAKTDILPGFVVRKKDNTHKIVIEKPIGVSSADNTEEDVKRYTQEWTSVLEKYVRAYPEQWVWIHERWKTRPVDKVRELTGVSEAR